MLTYALQPDGSASMYAQLYAFIRDDIAQGHITAGEKLPSKRTFAKHLGVSVITVEAAYDQLMAEGYVQSQPKRGYFACDLQELPEQVAVPPIQKSTHPLPINPRTPNSYKFDFVHPHYGVDAFPAKAWNRALREATDAGCEESLAAAADPFGSLRLRRAVADHLERYRGLKADPACVVIGAGAQSLYGLAVALLQRPATIAVEDPGYQGARGAYEMLGLQLRPVPCDGRGLRVDELARSGAPVVHVMPSHQFPTGTTMPVSRRYELLAWASDQPDRYVIEDDYDCEFRLTGRPIPALKGIDALGRVLYLNTFSRTLAPAVRVAYAVLPESLAERARQTMPFMAPSVSGFEQTALAMIMENGDFERHLNRMRKRYRDLRDSVEAAVSQSALGQGGRIHLEHQDSGLHFLLRFDGLAASEEDRLVAQAAQAGIDVRGLGAYRQLVDEAASAALVVNCAGMDSAAAAEGMTKLMKACE